MTVAFADPGLAVTLRNHGAFLQDAGITAQPQRAPQDAVFVLPGQEIDDRIVRVGIDLLTVGILHVAHVAGELDDGDLHAET